MGVFAYIATDTNAAVSRGTIVADSARQARDLLRSRGLRVSDVTQQLERTSNWSTLFGRRVSSAKVAMAIRELSTLISVGVPVVEAIETVTEQYQGAMKTALLLLKDKVASGASLAEAMEEQPGVFDELTTRMVEVGENSGNLDQVLQQLADFKERSMRLKDRVMGALLYPAIVLLTSLGVTLFLMTVVVPMLLTSLLEAERSLPWPTLLLKRLSDALVHHGFTLGAIVSVTIIATLAALRHPVGKELWHRALLRLPLIGQMIRKQTVSRLAMVMAALMRSGMVYLKALDIATKTTKNVVIRNALLRSGETVQAGQDIGTALRATNAFPPVVIQVFKVGQETGRLEEMLERLATDYDQQVASLSTRLASALEPILILLLAIFVGFILFATLLPILEAGNVM